MPCVVYTISAKGLPPLPMCDAPLSLLQHDFYNEQCSPETPLRCEIGDLSGRLGTIDLGQKRVVMSDPNLPLGERP